MVSHHEGRNRDTTDATRATHDGSKRVFSILPASKHCSRESGGSEHRRELLGIGLDAFCAGARTAKRSQVQG